MVKLVDTLDLGSSAEKHVGSSPISGNAQAGMCFVGGGGDLLVENKTPAPPPRPQVSSKKAVGEAQPPLIKYYANISPIN